MTIPRLVREEVFERDQWTCQYCLNKPAKVIDHLVPGALRRYHRLNHDRAPDFLTASCVDCNLRKLTHRLVPASRAHMIPQLPGAKPWRVWDGTLAQFRLLVA